MLKAAEICKVSPDCRLDRRQPMLPMRPGQPAQKPRLHAAWNDIVVRRARHRYRPVVGTCYARHRARELRKFLDEIEASVPPPVF
jgi:hypothetical protein